MSDLFTRLAKRIVFMYELIVYRVPAGQNRVVSGTYFANPFFTSYIIFGFTSKGLFGIAILINEILKIMFF